jgi:hypothetical protein
MTKYYKHLQRNTRAPIDFVKATLPWHLGGIYAYLANDLTIGAFMLAGFFLLNYIAER